MNVFRHLVELLGRGIGPTQGLYLHRTTEKRGYTSMPRVEFEPTTPVRALDRADVGTSRKFNRKQKYVNEV
jgi:hypothetical protein